MAGNATPQFTKNGVIGSVLCTAANTSSAGGGTVGSTIFLIVTADSTNGTYIEKVLIQAVATTPTAMAATVGRIFASSVTSGATTSANTYLIAEVTMPAVNADDTTNPVYPISVPIDFRLPAGWTLLFTNHGAPNANSNWRATAIGGDY